MTDSVLLSTAYLPPVSYFAKCLSYQNILIEKHEHFVKQTYRNRCSIYGANGRLDLIIPLVHGSERTAIGEKRISYHDNWRNLHWRSLESAYRSSPYFEFFEAEFRTFYFGEKIEFLFDFNQQLMNRIFEIMKLRMNIGFTDRYEKAYDDMDDFRAKIHPKINPETDVAFKNVPYYQVFENKYGFLPNLSIVDLLFNEGLRATDILKRSHLIV